MWGYRTCRVAGVRALRALVRPSHPHVGLLFRAWATLPMYGTGGPRAEQAARVRDALESKSLLHAANPHLRLLPMGSCTPSVGIATLLIGCSVP